MSRLFSQLVPRRQQRFVVINNSKWSAHLALPVFFSTFIPVVVLVVAALFYGTAFVRPTQLPHDRGADVEVCAETDRLLHFFT